jgi:tRNA modification GTPase
MDLATHDTDTIVAISTPPGRGGIGIVRLSGPEARRIAEPLLRLRHPLEPGRARFAEVIEVSGGPRTHVSESRRGAPANPAVLDEAVVTFFAAPNSYTSDDVVEIAAHGAPVLLDYLLRQCVAAGARLAEPGEFTQRAFLAGRLDLTQAEAVRSLIDATTLQQARTAAQQLGGGLSLQVQPVKRSLIELIAALEAGVDFAEDDLDLMADDEIARRMLEIELPLRVLEESFSYGRLLRDGFRLAIVGRPNAGKSSLFNRLIGRDRAIVTAQPGTTRDPVSERVDINGIPVELIDTAGLRTTADEAESYGIAKSREAMAEADVVLLVVAANEEWHGEDLSAMENAAGRKLIFVVNKIDLVGELAFLEPIWRWSGGVKSRFPLGMTNKPEIVVVRTSATDGTGIDELRRAILEALRAVPVSADTVPLTNLRQHGAITTALQALRSAQAGMPAAVPHEMLLLDLHECLNALDALTGTTHTEEILNLIFGSFCIGK